MRKLLVIALFALAPPAFAQSKTLSPGELREDVGILRKTFEDAHAGLYRYTPKAEIDAAFARVEAQLDRPMFDLELLRILAPLIDAVHDAHTSMSPSRDTLRRLYRTARVFPLDIRYAGGRAFIEKNFSADKTVPLAGEIAAINGTPMHEITEQVLLAKTTDGFNRVPKYEVANVNFWNSYHVLVCDSQRYDVDIRDPRTQAITRHSLDGVVMPDLDHQYNVQTHETFSLEYLDERTAVMSIPSFGDLALAGVFAKSFRELSDRRIQTLIIDIRNNGGGWDELNTELLSYLVPHPFRFYRRFTFRAKEWAQIKHLQYEADDFLNAPEMNEGTEAERKAKVDAMTLAEAIDHSIKTNPAAGIHQPKTDGFFRGNLYLLFNGRSGSSGGEVPALLHFLGVGTLIGEEPNAAYQGTTAGILPVLTLPHSGIQIRVPLVAYENAVLPGVLEGRGAQPHFMVSQSVDDAIAGRDTVMEFTLALIGSR